MPDLNSRQHAVNYYWKACERLMTEIGKDGILLDSKIKELKSCWEKYRHNKKMLSKGQEK